MIETDAGTSASTVTTTRRADPRRDRLAVSPRPRARLRGRAHKVALTAHVLSSVGWFGVALLVAFCGIVAGSTSDPILPAALYRTMHTVLWLSIPTGIVAVITGVVLSLGTVWGLVRHWWVVAKIAISVAVIVTDAVIVNSATANAAVTGTAPSRLRDATIAHCVALAVATGLSIFKPRGRTPRGRRVLADAAPGGHIVDSR